MTNPYKDPPEDVRLKMIGELLYSASERYYFCIGKIAAAKAETKPGNKPPVAGWGHHFYRLCLSGEGGFVLPGQRTPSIKYKPE